MLKYMTTLDDLKIVNLRYDIAKLLKRIDAKKICEIGVRYGENFKAMLIDSLEEAVAIDVWMETGVISQNDECIVQSTLDDQYNNMVDLYKKDSRVKIIRDFSISASKQFEDSYFDFVYIDADHTEEAVNADLNAWYLKVRSGGVLAGHDYFDAVVTCERYNGYNLKFGVVEAVNNFVNKNKLSLYLDNNQSWFIPKP
jgi:hypothetical protein